MGHPNKNMIPISLSQIFSCAQSFVLINPKIPICELFPLKAFFPKSTSKFNHQSNPYLILRQATIIFYPQLPFLL